MGTRSLAQASATLPSGSGSPGIVAQPCFPTYSPLCQELSSFSAISFRAFAESLPDWTTQIGASRLTTVSRAVISAVVRAVPPVTHPPQLKPMIIVRTAEATQVQKTSVLVGRASLHLSRKPKLSLFRSIRRLLHPYADVSRSRGPSHRRAGPAMGDAHPSRVFPARPAGPALGRRRRSAVGERGRAVADAVDAPSSPRRTRIAANISIAR